ncbi:MAG: hypothetical protein RL291_658 [Pseudomonadota bacterium]|jgi:hypothetical protein
MASIGAQKMRTAKVALAATIVSVGLAGCESSGVLNSAAPQTALAPTKAEPPKPQPVKVAFAQVIGAPDVAARQIQQDMTTAASAQNIALVPATEPTALTIRGYFVAGKDRAGTKFSYIWDVTDTTGNRVHRFAGDEVGAAVPANQRDNWVALTPPMSQSMAQKSVASIAPVILQRQGGGTVQPQGLASAPPATAPIATAGAPVPPAAQPAPQGRVQPAAVGSAATAPRSAIVASVTGAPGDGTTALSAALRNELARGGLNTAGAPGSYRVEGVVRLGPANAEGNQPISIDWHVKDQSGQRVGTVSQKNEVPQGSLDGPWGESANLAAAAAARGIIKLVNEHGQRTASTN